MLNEIREFEQYQEIFTDIKDIDKYRLAPYVYFKNNHKNGLRRAMTIVARKALEERKYFETTDIDDQKKIIESVKNDLRIWCGFTEPDGETSIKPWLKQFYELAGKKNSKYENWSGFCKAFDKACSRGLFEIALDDEKNSIYTISYEGIIADAVFLGPLKRYYLVCKLNGAKDLSTRDSKGNGYRSFREGGKDSEKTDCIRKFVAAYLLKQQTTMYHNVFNNLNNADLANWTQNNAIFKVEFFNRIRYKDQPIYIREPVIAVSENEFEDENSKTETVKRLKKCIPNPQYLTDYNFHIVAEDKFDINEVTAAGETFYSDMGSYINDGKKHCFLCEGLEYKDMEKRYSIKC